jgi:solute:Na+ symporter, SSS family
VFSAADKKFQASENPGDGILLGDPALVGYSTLAFGSALALFLYPHSVTAVLASRSRDVIKRNMAALPAYSLVLGLLALLGYMAIAAGITPIGADPQAGVPGDSNTIVPLLYDKMFSDWFAGVAFAAIAIGALVPAAIMSIAAANLWTRNIYKEYLKRDATPQQEARMSKLASLVVKAGAVAVILVLDPSFSIDLQLIGGVIILQTLPSVVLGLYTRWFHGTALLFGWAAGLIVGLWMLYVTDNPLAGKEHFAGAIFQLSKFGLDTTNTIYTGLVALIVNLVVAAIVSAVMRSMGTPYGEDVTVETDYHVEAGDPGVTAAVGDTGSEAELRAGG